MSQKLNVEPDAKHCEQCGAKAQCVDSRATGAAIRRRYNCDCGHRYSTVEVRVEIASGHSNVFDAGEKIANAMQFMADVKALLERPIAERKVE